MKTKLTPAAQDRMLSSCPWTADGKVVVTCTFRTTALLRAAGVINPRVLESYPVEVHRKIIAGKMHLLLGPPASIDATATKCMHSKHEEGMESKHEDDTAA